MAEMTPQTAPETTPGMTPDASAEKSVGLNANAPEKPASASPASAPAGASAAAQENVITIDDFFRVQLRVGQILAAERVEKSEKLLKLSVDLGESREPRQIVSGIAKHYTPESIVGRKIVVVANLKPAKLMGLLSEGMLLAADDGQGNLELVFPGAAMPAGSTVR